MESKSKIFGHPAHTILIVFPLGLLATSVVFDGLYTARRSPKLAETAFGMLISGLVGGAMAAPFGWWDWRFIPAKTRAKQVGLVHGLGNAAVLGLFGTSAWLRRPNPAAPTTAARQLSVFGAGLAFISGWLGGELVNRLGVGVDDGANLDASNSLSGKPASGS